MQWAPTSSDQVVPQHKRYCEALRTLVIFNLTLITCSFPRHSGVLQKTANSALIHKPGFNEVLLSEERRINDVFNGNLCLLIIYSKD